MAKSPFRQMDSSSERLSRNLTKIGRDGAGASLAQSKPSKVSEAARSIREQASRLAASKTSFKPGR